MEPQTSPEEEFRYGLEFTAILLRKLAPVCTTLDELVGMCEYAKTNDAQLRLLMREVGPVRMKK